jgi:hypothetical protein
MGKSCDRAGSLCAGCHITTEDTDITNRCDGARRLLDALRDEGQRSHTGAVVALAPKLTATA